MEAFTSKIFPKKIARHQWRMEKVVKHGTASTVICVPPVANEREKIRVMNA
jgi:hypothetical protein